MIIGLKSFQIGLEQYTCRLKEKKTQTKNVLVHGKESRYWLTVGYKIQFYNIHAAYQCYITLILGLHVYEGLGCLRASVLSEYII